MTSRLFSSIPSLSRSWLASPLASGRSRAFNFSTAVHGTKPTLSTSFFTARTNAIRTTRVPTPPAISPAGLRSFSNSALLQFARNRVQNVRNTYYSQPFRSGGGPGWSPKPPLRQSWLRQRIDRINPDYLFYGILGLNGVVFAGWWYATESWKNFRDPSLVYWMENNFTTSWRNIREGRLWTLVTACFSHSAGDHILLNLMSFYFMARPALMMLGNSSFLVLYLGGGALASGVSALWNYSKGRYNDRSHGASGAIFAITAFYATVFPWSTFLLFFVIPAPACLVVGGLAAWDLYSALGDKRRRIDSVGHLGGTLAGFLYALRRIRGSPF